MYISKKLDPSFFIGVLKRYFPAVLLSGILCGLECFILLFITVPRQYESRALISIESEGHSAESPEYFLNACRAVSESAAIQDNLIANLDLPYTREQLNKMISAESSDSKGKVKLIVRCGDAYDAKTVVNELAELSVQEFNRVITFGAAEVSHFGELNTKPLLRGSIPLFTIAAFLAGIIASCIISYFHAAFDKVVRSDDDIAQNHGFPVLASIPELNREKKDVRSTYYMYKKIKNNSFSEYILSEGSPITVSKAYDSARMSLISAVSQNEKKIIAVTSANDSEGKSTLCSNMAVSFANAGFKVLLVECDMINPTISKSFGIAPKFGLSAVLKGLCAVSEAVAEGVVRNLDVIPAGRVNPDSAELLCSDSMKAFLEASAENYNYVFLDTPSLSASGDSQLMNGSITGFVFVIKENSTTHPDVESAIDKINSEKVNILGLVKTLSCV